MTKAKPFYRSLLSLNFAKIIILILLCISNNAYSASNPPTPKLCNILTDYFSGAYKPEELCKKYEGDFCSTLKSSEQAVCAANGASFCGTYNLPGEALCEAADGNFCSTTKTIAAGLCAALGESFCSSETDDSKWKKNVITICQTQAQTQNKTLSLTSCSSSADCQSSGSLCKDRGDGVKLCMGEGKHGDFCSSSADCESSGICKDPGDGLNRCMQTGAKGQVCNSGVDCGSGLLCKKSETEILKTCQ